MKIRYGHNAKRKLLPIAKVYTKDEHRIQKKNIAEQALFIIYRLVKNGYEAYIVGGAVRDLLLDKIPKDFDIATNARPNTIRRLFNRAHIIGKRFRIVLIHSPHNNSSIEVTTFRSVTDFDYSAYDTTIFGSMDQDVLRRDFTCNALYYCPISEEIVDYKNGVSDIKKRLLIPIRREFGEDPVRMLRALKFSVKCQLKIPLTLKLEIKKNTHLITQVSRSRMTEEVMKILASGQSADILKLCLQYKLLQYMLPNIYIWLTEKQHAQKRMQNMYASCKKCDDLITRNENKITRAKIIEYFIHAFVQEILQENLVHNKNPSVQKIMDAVKKWLQPITPPNTNIYIALHALIPTQKRKYKNAKRRKNRMKVAR